MSKYLVAMMMAVVVSGCGQENASATNSAQVTQEENLTIEHKFAIVNAGKMVPESDPSVTRARELLARSSEEYGEDKNAIADMCVKASKIIRNEGVEVSALEVLEATALAYVNKSNLEFSKAAAMYIGLRKGGQPHADAMMGMKGMIQALTPRD